MNKPSHIVRSGRELDKITLTVFAFSRPGDEGKPSRSNHLAPRLTWPGLKENHYLVASDFDLIGGLKMRRQI